MTPESINASIVAARLTGHLKAMIDLAIHEEDYNTAIMHLKVLISTYTGNEYNRACDAWLLEFKQDLKKYESLRIKNFKK